MAAKYLDRFPQNYVKELQIIVHELNQAVLQNKPNDILHFLAHYFNDLNKKMQFVYDPAKEFEQEKIQIENNTLTKEENVVLDGPIEEYEKTALMIQKKFRSVKKKPSPTKK